jgi:hypothetical protein
MDAFELLKADHKKVADLFERLDAATGQAKLDLFKQINDELEVHTFIEETIFYPALEKPEETHDLTLEAYEEHKVVKTLLAELSGARTADDEWQARAKVLRENVEHHVDEEENELFDKADDALTDEQIEALGEQMEAAKAKRLGQPVLKQPSVKEAQTKASTQKPGLLSKIAGLVGLGSGAPKKKAAKKAAAAKKAMKKKAAKTLVKKTASKSNKRSSGSTAKKTAAKSQKRSSRTPKQRSSTGAKKQATKKRGTRK